MKPKNSLAVPIIALLILISLSTLLIGYYVNLQALRTALESREMDKTDYVHFIINSIITKEIERLSAVSKVLKENKELTISLIYYESFGDLEPVKKAGNRLFPNLKTAIFDIFDTKGNHIYCGDGNPAVTHEYGEAWGMDEALEGKEVMALAKNPEGWAIRVFMPIHSEEYFRGVVALGFLIDDQFAQKIAAATNSQVSLATARGVFASSLLPGKRNSIDLEAIKKSLGERRPISLNDHANANIFRYAPLVVVDETFCLIVQTDSRAMQGLLNEKRKNLFSISIAVLLVVILVAIAFILYLINPLKKLKKNALQIVKEYSGKEMEVLTSGNEIQALGQAHHLMLETIHNRLAERKLAEQNLRESEKKFRDLYDNAPLGYHEYDKEGRITNVNQTDLEMLGYTAEEMIGQFMWKFNVGEKIVREQILAKLAGTLPPGRNLERTYRRKDGTTFPVLIEDRLILDEKEQIKGIRCTIQDITERKRAEQEMAALQEQLRQSQKMEAIGKLAGGIAHDFNNLLTVIKGYNQLSLLELKKDDPLRANIEEVQKAAERAANLTRHILAFSRRQILEFKVFDLNHLLHNLDKMLRRVIGEDIELVTFLSEDLGRVKTDAGQIEQVVMNLAVNARDAMPNGGKLTIETANVELDENYAQRHAGVTPGRYVMLAVSDTGVGMAPEVKERIFEPFFTTKEMGKGTGLGLSVVYGIMKQSGGNIWVYSEPGQGTTFKVYLPRVDEAVQELRGKEAEEEIPRGSETILVVEDEEPVRKLAVRVLQGQGYRVLDASQGDEALLIFKQHQGPIHMMVTDMVMPGMSGPQLVKRLQSFNGEIKVLYMSGYADSAIVRHDKLESRMPYIQKPFTPDALLRKVREVLKK
jgi:two-component system cell cycle sensor histidine kinase/response regulator CckA